MKKQTVLALALLLLVPVVMVLGGMLSSLINPEIAAGHPNYSRNFHILTIVKHLTFFVPLVIGVILWFFVCFLVLRSKEQSPVWMFFAALGPLGFAVLETLNDKAPGETDRYSRFVRSMNIFVRIGYELVTFWCLWELGYLLMVLKRNVTIMAQSAFTGVSAAQIIATQDASSGMWAFGESLEVMFIVVVLYLLRPILFNIVARIAASTATRNAR
jgi:hypothetical protein